jgi:hypothetical protein
MLERNIETALKTFTEIILGAAECMRRKYWSSDRERDTNRWFDRECLASKRAARKELSRFRRTGSEEDRQRYRRARAQYKTTIAAKKSEYKEKVKNALLADKKNSSRFWDTIKKTRQKKSERT